jgi:Cu/Ag efflux protein CusF
MKILLSLALALTLGLAACGGNDAGSNGETGSSARSDGAADTNSASGAGSATDGASGPDTNASAAGGTVEAGSVQEYTFHGEVKKIDAERQMITIDHERIGDYMEAMTMPFKVADPALLGRVKVGQKTHFTLRVAGDQALITKVQDEHEGGQEH